MNGNEKILERILSMAKDNAASIEAEAEQKAASRIEEERAALAEQLRAAEAEEQLATEYRLNTVRSAAALAVRNAELSCRRQEIDRTVEATLAHLRALPTEEYFALLRRLIEAHREGTGGVLLLSAADKSRVPAGFADELGLTLEETGELGGGCILRYGDIEENLTFGALAEERRDQLEDVICRELFRA